MKKINVAVHNKYEFITKDGFLFKSPQSDIGHNLLKPWNDLKRVGEEQEIFFFTLDQIKKEEIDVAIFMDRPDVEPELPDGIKKIFMIYEPDIIIPGNWDVEYHKKFDKIYTWDDRLIDNVRYFKHNFTTDFDEKNLEITEEEFKSRKLLFLMNTAKMLNHPDCLYGHRFFAAEYFQKEALFEFDIYGRGWNLQKFPTYKGPVKNKLEVMRKYKFCLAYENSKHAVGYITEKMSDCIMAGVVPIYYGAPNVTDHIPKECFIDVRDTDNYAVILETMRNTTYEQYMGYLNAMKKFIKSEKADDFKNEVLVNRLLTAIREIT